MSVNLLPDVWRPVFVKIARIFNKENLIDVTLEIAALLRANRNRIVFSCEWKYGHHLLVVWSQWRNIGHYILNREFLQRRQHSGLMREIRFAALPIVGIVPKLIAELHPHRLLGQLPRSLQIVSVQP